MKQWAKQQRSGQWHLKKQWYFPFPWGWDIFHIINSDNLQSPWNHCLLHSAENNYSSEVNSHLDMVQITVCSWSSAQLSMQIGWKVFLLAPLNENGASSSKFHNVEVIFSLIGGSSGTFWNNLISEINNFTRDTDQGMQWMNEEACWFNQILRWIPRSMTFPRGDTATESCKNLKFKNSI